MLPPFHHNPTFVGPTPDGTFLLFFIGADNATDVLDCTGGVPAHTPPIQVPSNHYITMAWTTDPVNGASATLVWRSEADVGHGSRML